MPRAPTPPRGPFPAAARVGVLPAFAGLRARNGARPPVPRFEKAFAGSHRAVEKGRGPMPDRDPLPHLAGPIRCADGRSDDPFSGSWICAISTLADRGLGKGPAA